MHSFGLNICEFPRYCRDSPLVKLYTSGDSPPD